MIALTDLRIGVEAGELVVRIALTDANRAALAALLQLQPSAVAKRTGRGGDRRSLPDLPPIASTERDSQDGEIKRRYLEELESIPDVAFALGIGVRQVENALARLGVAKRSVPEAMRAKWERRRRSLIGAPPRPMRASGRRRLFSDERAAELKRRYLDDLESTTALAVAYNTTPQTITNTLHRLGVETRSRNEAVRIANERAAPDPRSAGAPRRAQPDAPPALERLAEPRPVKPAKDAKAKPPAKPAAPKPEDHPKANEIVRLYVDEECSIPGIVEILDDELSAERVRKILAGRGVALRGKAEAAKLRHEQIAARREAIAKSKLPPLVVPADAPRKTVKLEHLRPIERFDQPKRKPSEALRENKDRTFKIARQKRAAAMREPATAAELQSAVSNYFDKGGAITAIESPKIDQTARPAVGLRNGMSGRR
jgi:hypothetical protein